MSFPEIQSFLLQGGLPALFFLSFLAATLLPLGSEWFLALLLLHGYEPLPAVFVATCGNYLGSLTSYLIGIYGSDFLREKVLRISEKDMKKAEIFYNKWGKCSLLFSWFPIIGDPLCLVAGIFRLSPYSFSGLVLLGKGCRYTILAYLVIKSQTVV